MKKLLLILSAVFVSVSMMAAVNPDTDWNLPNPFAYDLKSEVIDNGATLKLTYSLNADAVTDKGYNNQSGLQIYLIDKNGERIKNADGTVWVNTAGAYTKGTHSVNISVANLPPAAKDKLVSWEVVVHGNKNRTQPKLVYTNIKTDNSVFYPRAAHGIAVGKNPDKPNFAKLFTAEASTNTLSGKSVPNSLWEYNMQMKYQKYHHKDILDGGTSHFSAVTNTEPHRVKISDDGRIFATCYHETAISAVLEYVGNGNWKTVVIADVKRNSYQDEVLYSKADKYNRRPIAMDVKGSGDNLKIIVAWMKPKGKKINNNGKNDRMHAQIQVIEYEVGSNNYNIDQDNGTVVAEYIDHDTEGNRGGTYDGMLFQSYYYGYNQALHGFIGVAYGDDNSIWLKVDFGFGISDGRRSHILRYDQGSKEAKYTYTFPSADKYRHTTGGYYGGAGLLIKGNQLITGSGSNALLVYTIKNDKTLDTNESNVKSYGCGSPGTSTWLDAIAEDYAGNLYCISEAADNIVIFAMPYDGTRKTRANSTFTVSDPIPNILATDLRFAPDGNSDRYVFSFNVNTTPKVAQIRFYKSYGDKGDNDMKKNLAKINADDYQGGNAITPSFVYDIPTDQLKQGKISVSLGMCGGIIEGGKITNNKLPRGEWYWSVYVEAPRKSSVFAPIYKQGTTGEDAHYRLHATVNNYPETDQFGHLYAVNYHTGGDTRNGLMVYGFNPNGNSNDEQNNILNSYRYKLVKNYLNPTGSKPKFTNQRRLDVAPDGKVYIADCGSSLAFNKTADRPWLFTGGGVFVWNPNTQTGNEIQISQFTLDKTETSTAVTIYNHSGQMKLYATNTYGEFDNHANNKNYWKGYEYTEANQANVNIYGWNGFKEFNLGTPGNILLQETNGTTPYSLGMGDGNGNISIVATEKGIWMAQHREGDVQYSLDNDQALPDVPANYILSFIPYGNTTSSNPWGGRTWRSCTTIGTGSYADQKSANSQTVDAPLQSCPGAGLAYKKVNNKEYLYIVQHSGDIAQFEIRSWNGTTPSVYHVRTYPSVGNKTVIGHGTNTVTTRPTGTITSMCFDYAGNLITTAGQTYFKEGMGSQDIIVYTMPYNRVNAREIQAPNSCRYIPERVSHLNMGDEELSNIISENQDDTCHVDIFRPMFNTSFSTICLPFDVDLSEASANEYKDAKLMTFAGAVITDINKEKMLELQFTEITDGKLKAGIPYLIQPQEPITQIVHLAQLVSFESITPKDQKWDFTDGDQKNSITFKGIIPYQQIEVDPNKPWPLIVVDNNRLAEVSTTGYINGFRAYFQLEKELAPGTKVGISARKPTPTNVITIDGKRVNIEKFLREGRVYIRVGDSLYTITGEKVE